MLMQNTLLEREKAGERMRERTIFRKIKKKEKISNPKPIKQTKLLEMWLEIIKK